MKSLNSWNRRDFIVKPVAGLAALQLFGSLSNLFGQTPKAAGDAAQAGVGAKPIYRPLGKTGSLSLS